MHLNPLGIRQLDLRLLYMNHPYRRSHVEAYLGSADAQQCALAMPRAHINTTIQLSFTVIYLILVTLAGYCEGFKYQYSHLTLLSFTCNFQPLRGIGVVPINEIAFHHDHQTRG
jgi:hypothetical protein